MNWTKQKISDFLIERKERYKPDEANILSLPRISKIDFSGNIHLSNHKTTKTNMILVKKGDLLISGINVQKGGLTIYDLETDALATIHYSSYLFDKNKIRTQYLKWFLKSPSFKRLLQRKSGKGIKTELKAKAFLALEIFLPDLNDQDEIVKKLDSIEHEINELKEISKNNNGLISKLRLTILNDAFSGELTKKWRNENESIEDAKTLLEKIRVNRKLKNPNIGSDLTTLYPDIKIPNSWSVCYFGDYAFCERGRFSARPRNDPQYYNGDIPFIQIGDLPTNGGLIEGFKQTLNSLGLTVSKLFPANTVVIAIVGSTIGNTGILYRDMCFPDSLVGIKPTNDTNTEFIEYYLRYKKKYFREASYAGGGQPNIRLPIINESVLFLPPLTEQQIIVEKINTLFNFCDLMRQNSDNQILDIDLLIQSALINVFGIENNKLGNSHDFKDNSNLISYSPSPTIGINNVDNMSDTKTLVDLLREHGKLSALDLWQLSKFSKDIDEFYEQLKIEVEIKLTIRESGQKGFLELSE